MIIRAFAFCSVTGGALLLVDLFTGANRSGSGHAGKQHDYEAGEFNPRQVPEVTQHQMLIDLHRKAKHE
jgi:hypothetical protein